MSRKGKTQEGSYEYEVAPGIRACRMGNDEWVLFRVHEGKLYDMGYLFKTLREARAKGEML